MISILKKIRMIFIRFKYRRFLFAGKNFTSGRGTLFYARNRIVLGDNVYLGRYCNIECDAVVGNDVLIANNVGFVGRLDHDYSKVGIPIRFAPCVRDRDYLIPPEKTAVHVGDDVWIGYGAIILSGVTINSGAIIAAGSLVTKDVEAFTVVGGVPARPITHRFCAEDIPGHVEACRISYSSYGSAAYQNSRKWRCRPFF